MKSWALKMQKLQVNALSLSSENQAICFSGTTFWSVTLNGMQLHAHGTASNIAVLRVTADAAAEAAVVPAESAALPGGSAAQREHFRKAQQKQREAAVWRQTASCICAHYALYWRREGTEFPAAPAAGK